MAFAERAGSHPGRDRSGGSGTREHGRPSLRRRRGHRYPAVLAGGQRGLVPRHHRPDALALLQHRREPFGLLVRHAVCPRPPCRRVGSKDLSSTCLSGEQRRKENRRPVSGGVPVRQHLSDPPPVAVAPVVRQPLIVARPSREVRVFEERLRRPETALLPTVPVGRLLPSDDKLPDFLLLLDHLRSFWHILRDTPIGATHAGGLDGLAVAAFPNRRFLP